MKLNNKSISPCSHPDVISVVFFFVFTTGVQVSMGVAHHGLALNCNTDLSWFDHINPCGIEGKGVTSITQCIGRNGEEI